MPAKQFYIYIMTNKRHTVLYTGMTSDLAKRVWEHMNKVVKGFTSKYNISKLVYYEIADDAEAAASREKQLKRWKRKWKEDLVADFYPDWRDLYEEIVS